MDAHARETLEAALADPRVAQRYRALVSPVAMSTGCRPWLGALSAKGSGRFWLGGNRVIIAHRYGYALTYGIDALLAAPQIAHRCDEACCQTPHHWATSTGLQNTLDWINRRHTLGNPLRDTRGALGRARALRQAARTGTSLTAASKAGQPEIDRYQNQLPDIGY